MVLSMTPDRRDAIICPTLGVAAGVLTVVLPPKPFWYWPPPCTRKELSKSSAVSTWVPSGDQRTPSLSRKSLETSTIRASIITWSEGASRSLINLRIWGKKWTLAETRTELARSSATNRTLPTRSLTGRELLRLSEERRRSAWPPSQG